MFQEEGIFFNTSLFLQKSSLPHWTQMGFQVYEFSFTTFHNIIKFKILPLELVTFL